MDPSITKRLIDFGIDDHEYDEVDELPEDTDKKQQNQQQQQKSSKQSTSIDLPPELPPPKQKGVKNSKNKSKSKSKIPRSPSLAISLGANNSNNSTGDFSQSQTQIQSPSSASASASTSKSKSKSSHPPQTPPLPANYQNKSKHMNGSTAGTPNSPTTTSPANNNSNTNNNNNNVNSNNNINNNANNSTLMGGGVQLSGVGGGVGGVGGGSNASPNANGANNHQRDGSFNNNVGGRRPHIQISPITETKPKNFQYLALTVRKDENGYGMKVSGDNPVFVESVKPGGAAQIAGLVAADMILKVNGQEVRSEKHPTVVKMIKSSDVVELVVRRSQKMTRPTSVGIVPSTPVLGRDRTAAITGPQPVDSIKRREMETYKIQTLQKMLEQEKLNLERLKGDTNNPSYKLSEANIRTLREQLHQIGAEYIPNQQDAPPIKYQPTVNNKQGTAILSPNQIHHLSASSHHQQHSQHKQHQQHNHLQQQAITPQPQPQSSVAFLSLLPRSLSSLSLGTRKYKIDKDLITSPQNNTTDFMMNSSSAGISPMSQSFHHQQQQQQQQRNSPQALAQLQHQKQLILQQYLQETPKSTGSKNKNKFAAQAAINLIHEDIPPPLPQRNPPRGSLQLDISAASANLITTSSNNNNNSNNVHMFSPISDLDHTASPQRNSPQSFNQSQVNSSAAAQKKRAKSKTKALSDPKMSTQMFLQMESVGPSGMSGGAGVSGGGVSQTDCIPPPLPPRQPGIMEETPKSTHRGSFQNLARPPPNSIDTVLNYPLVSTCTPVIRDNMAAAFPFSQRPNIVQQLQQHQQLHGSGGNGGSGNTTAVLGQTPHNLNQMSKHRRVLSSPDNMHPRHPDRHNKSTSGSWELVEKDDEETPPGTPPPPYITSHSSGMMAGGDDSMAGIVTPTGGGGIFVESHHFVPLGGSGITSTPALSALHSSRIQAASASATQRQIISMEDEDASDQEGPFIDENGPFNYIQRLLEAENVAFLAVFLNYVLSNSEPAPLLFYLITSLYKEGTAKDMRKWSYEIHSTFLVPRAPLAWYRQDESLAREVDNVLQNEFDKEEILRKVFWKSRKRARDIICEQLREFQQKRTAGLGTIYGPTDAQLSEAKGDKQREQQIFEETLMRKLQIFIEEYEKDAPIEDPRKLALCSALSTVIHRIFITRSHPNSIVDRVHHFVSREKSFKSRLMGKNRKMSVRGHPLVLRQYYEVTHCNHCQTIIWGVSPQGYHCTDCKLNIHRPCSKVLDESCPGPLTQTKHNDNKISKFMGKIRPRTSSDFIAAEKRARQEEDIDLADVTNERLHATSIVRQPSDRRPDASGGGVTASSRPNGNASHNSNDLQTSFHARSASGDGSSVDAAQNVASGAAAAAVALSAAAASGGGEMMSGGTHDAGGNIIGDGKDGRRERLHHQHQQNKSAPVSVNRSESYKERLSHKRNRTSRRKTSDPSLTSRPNDDPTEAGLSNSNYTASSNSSLSSGGGSESPSTSMEQVGGSTATTIPGATSAHHHHGGSVHHHGPHHAHLHSHQDSFQGSLGGSSSGASFWGGSIGGAGGPTIGQLTRQWNFESDEDDDLNDWSSNVAADLLSALTDAEKKRQEIINEIYQTERSHVRTLKLLERLFFCPLQESGVLSNDHLKLLFPPALLSLRELHNAFEQKLKQRRIEHNHVVNHVGDLLATMFDGPAGEDLREHAALFCARQQIALEALKEKRRKDEQLQKLLSKAESHKACRRLQLKDLLPTVLQRLTKYPLLFENLYKVTIRVVPENTTEAEAIQRALESSKKILVDVNQAVKTAEDAHKLQNIQRKLDKSTFDKDEFKNLDLTQYRLIHDGSLTMKKNPSIQLHGLLFETMIVLLTKQDDKYSLKYLHAARNTEVNNKPVSPIMSIDSETLVRQEAADKNSFFLIKTKTSQMLELRAPSSSECKTWFKHISDAAEQYKPRSKNANHEPVDDPAIATLPHSNTKESLELTPERPPPMSATATVTTTPLAPMLPPATVHSHHVNNNNYDGGVHMRNGRRESTPTSNSMGGGGGSSSGDGPAYQNLQHRQHLSQHELSPAVNRTMSTRSCGEANNNYGADHIATVNGVTLRHTQSARQASAESVIGDVGAATATVVGGASKRDSASIVYSNNSNNTRTLMQSSPPLVEPTAIQISISPAHTAEPVLTLAERLRRLDASIRDGLLEKQKIICDMFRLPVEHFHEIVDIAAMPEAPKDSADIALAAYAQVQSLTEVLNEYMLVTPEQQISAVSTAVCDQCHEKQRHNSNHAHHHPQQQQQNRPLTPLALSTSTSSSSGVSTVTQIPNADSTPPPLPPPNKQPAQLAQQQTPAPTAAKLLTPIGALEEANIHEDDDGYCEIDELRLPSLPPHMTVSMGGAKAKSASPPPPLPPPAGSFKTPPQPPPLPPQASTSTTVTSSQTPELIKRQSTISTDSIPEESADELTQAALEDDGDKAEVEKPEGSESNVEEKEKLKVEPTEANDNNALDSTTTEAVNNSNETGVEATDETTEATTEQSGEQTAINAALSTLNKLNAVISTVDNTTQTLPLMPQSNQGTNLTNTNINEGQTLPPLCGPNRIQHANSLEPSIPCHALNTIVSALNAQISLLLPKINERDMERERLRKENQHLRELLNAMHERQRVEDKLETPTDNNAAAVASQKDNDEIDGTKIKIDTPTQTATSTSSTSTTTTTTEKVEN